MKKVLKERGYTTLVGDEGGYAPALKTNAEAVEVILMAIEKAGYKPGEQISIALDPAASEFYDKETGLYNLRSEGKKLTSEEMGAFWKDWVTKYPIVSIEDGFCRRRLGRLQELRSRGWRSCADRGRRPTGNQPPPVSARRSRKKPPMLCWSN